MRLYWMGLPRLPGPNWRCQLFQTSKMPPHWSNRYFLRGCVPGTKVMWICVCQSLSQVRLFVIPRTVAYQTLLSMEFSRQEYWSGLAISFSRDLPNPGIAPRSPALQADSLPSEPSGKPQCGSIFSAKYMMTILVLKAAYTTAEFYIPSPDPVKFSCWRPNTQSECNCIWRELL